MFISSLGQNRLLTILESRLDVWLKILIMVIILLLSFTKKLQYFNPIDDYMFLYRDLKLMGF